MSDSAHTRNAERLRIAHRLRTEAVEQRRDGVAVAVAAKLRADVFGREPEDIGPAAFRRQRRGGAANAAPSNASTIQYSHEDLFHDSFLALRVLLLGLPPGVKLLPQSADRLELAMPDRPARADRQGCCRVRPIRRGPPSPAQ